MSADGRAVTAEATAASTDSVVFVLPGQLRDLTEGRSHIGVRAPETGTLEGAFAGLRRGYPAVYDRIFTERGEIRPHVNVFVDGDDIRWAGGLHAEVGEGSEVIILPAVSGG